MRLKGVPGGTTITPPDPTSSIVPLRDTRAVPDSTTISSSRVSSSGRASVPAGIPTRQTLASCDPVAGAASARERLAGGPRGWTGAHRGRAGGDGHRDGLTAGRAPEGASILAGAEAGDGLAGGGEGLSPQEALETLRAEAGHRFANEVIEALVRLQRDSMSTV